MEFLYELTREAEFWVLVGFGLFLIVAWNPLRKALNAQLSGHIEKVQNLLQEAEAIRNEAAETLAKAKKHQLNIENECGAILAHAEHEAASIIAKAEAESERIIAIHRAAAKDKIAKAQAQARADLRIMAGEMVLAATSAVLQKQMEGRLASSLIDQAITKIPEKLSS